MDNSLNKMRIAVLSGKGGTGKTLVSVNLAAVAGGSVYIDCDVEEPNGRIFLKPENTVEETVYVPGPRLNPSACDGCGKCAEFCAFNALAMAKGKPMVFDGICHGCGGCVLVCPQKALLEKPRPIGRVERGESQDVSVHTGILNEGEASGVPIIKKLLAQQHKAGTPVILDCPPGAACSVIESVQGADVCILVAEPTRYGAANLALVHELAVLLEKPHGALLNKCLDGDNPSQDLCHQRGIPVFGRIPFDRDLGTLCAEGRVAAREEEKYRTMFLDILDRVVSG